MKAMVTLTSEKSKRLIGKSIAGMGPVKKAMREGFIGFSLCTSCGYVIQELLGESVVDPGRYCCGFTYSDGTCHVPPGKREKLLLLDKGKERWLDFPSENFTAFIHRMGEGDIIIKSGNLIDPEKNAGVLVAALDGGEAGNYLPHILTRGIQLIVPMTLNKTVPISLSEIIPQMGISKFRPDRVHGKPCGLLPLPGRVITEVDAFKDLFSVTALPVAMNGVGSGEGTVTLVLTGDDQAVDKAWQAVNDMKDEPRLKNYFSNCLQCDGASGDPEKFQCATRLKETSKKLTS